MLCGVGVQGKVKGEFTKVPVKARSLLVWWGAVGGSEAEKAGCGAGLWLRPAFCLVSLVVDRSWI